MILSDAIYTGKAEIKNIIFDWGGVISDLHLEATQRAFQALGLTIFDKGIPHQAHDELFIPFETGKISAEEFRNRIRALSKTELSDAQIDGAWNAMLGVLPEPRWNLLDKVRNFYHTFLLSNTNSIHLNYYSHYLQGIYGTFGYTHLFEKSYFSHILGMRKPNAEIFEHVRDDAKLLPRETLFIDDFVENIESAGRLGFQTIHLVQPLTLTRLFKSRPI
jgi:putative hydrolase of the HAD superfamily